MKRIAIKVNNLAKTYRIVGPQPQYRTLRDTLSEACAESLRALRTRWRGGTDQAQARSTQEPYQALRGVSFEIESGEIVGVIGRNGAGKSTLLKILSRITEPSAGVADIYGRVGSLLEVGTGFHQELSGRDNVFLNGAILGMKRAEIERKFDEIVDFAEIEGFIDTPVKRYSTGMQLRLAFAVAAHLEPEILLVDEVLAVGDARFQKKCLNKMQDVGQQGRTVLFVSHNMTAVTRLCRRCLLLDHGQLIKDGASHEVVSAYMHSESGTTGERVWRDEKSAPAGTVARLRSVRVADAAGKVIEAVDIREPVCVQMGYEVMRAGSVLLPFFIFFNEEGVLAFAANDLDPNWRLRPRPQGEYRSVVEIPGNLLSEGTLFVGAGMVTDAMVTQFYEADAVALHVVDSLDGNSARGDYAGNMRGVVRPMLKWQTFYKQRGGLCLGEKQSRSRVASLIEKQRLQGKEVTQG
jgi:lipopolysaccharide transport system ATP-binding protein